MPPKSPRSRTERSRPICTWRSRPIRTSGVGLLLAILLTVATLLFSSAAPAHATQIHKGLQVHVALHDLDERRRPPLQRIVRRALKEVEHTFAATLDGNLRVDFAGSDESFRQLVKDGGAGGNFGEPWVAGLAILHADRVIVRLDGPGLLYTSEVVRHELAHIAIHALAKGHHLPRWFHEGVAMTVAGEATIDRLQQGLSSGSFGELESLDNLDTAFAGHRVKVQRAYAVAAGFIRFAIRRSGRRTALAELHKRMALGLSFGPAFTATFDLPPKDLYALYARYLDSSDSRWSLALSDSLLWALIGLLSLIAMGVAWFKRPRFDGEPMDLEAIAAIGEKALRSGMLWLPEDRERTLEGLDPVAAAIAPIGPIAPLMPAIRRGPTGEPREPREDEPEMVYAAAHRDPQGYPVVGEGPPEIH